MTISHAPNLGTALYYPYIYIQSLNWLKASLLYWDRIVRVVPESMHLQDDDSIKAVIDSGLLRPVYPEKYKDRAGNAFLDKLLPLVDNCASSGKTAILKEIVRGRSAHQSAQFSQLHVDKLSQTVQDKLQDLGLLKRSKEWQITVSHLAELYMTCLASEISEQEEIHALTDSPGYASCGEYISNGKLVESNNLDPLTISLTLNIGLPNLKSMNEIPIGKVIEFHQTYSDERQHFRSAIEELRQELAGFGSLTPAEISGYFESKRRSIESALTGYRLASTEILGVSLPTAAKWGIRVGILCAIEAATADPGLIAPVASVAVAESVNAFFEKRWFRPKDVQSTKIARYLLPFKQNFRTK